MTETLKRAMEQISKLPEAEQEAYGAMILEDLASNGVHLPANWRPSAELQQMVDRALGQEQRGDAITLDEFLGDDDK